MLVLTLSFLRRFLFFILLLSVSLYFFLDLNTIVFSYGCQIVARQFSSSKSIIFFLHFVTGLYSLERWLQDKGCLIVLSTDLINDTITGCHTGGRFFMHDENA